MAVGLTQAYAQVALETILPNGTNRYIGLLTTIPSDMIGTGLVELTGTGYARILKNAWLTNLSASKVERANNGAVQFTVGAGGWSGILGWGIWTAVSGGSLIGWGAIYNDALAPGPFSFPAGDLINVDCSLSLSP